MTLRISKTAAPPADFITYATHDCILGQVLIARSTAGVCAILLGDDRNELAADLAARFAKATHVVSEDAVENDLTQVIRFLETPTQGLHLSLDMRGTPFQRRVWEKIRAIPVGSTATYQELARWISPLASPRAIAGACAANPIALAIPCHRLVRSDGTLGDYCWGIARKQELLRREGAA